MELSSTTNKPAENLLPHSLEEASLAVKKDYLKDLSTRVVDQFILKEDKVNALIKKLEQQRESSDSKGRFPCRFSGCPKSSAHDGKRRISHEKTRGIHAQMSQPTIDQSSVEVTRKDDMLSYQLALLEYGMLFMNFSDAYFSRRQ